MGLNVAANQLDGWVPIRVYWNEKRPFVDWCWIGMCRFTEPFFDHTIDRALRLPFSTLFRPQTSIQILEERSAISPGLEPRGFIFHMSRCGSTLVSQMLAALTSTVVISEAGPVDSLLRMRFTDGSITDANRIDWLRWLVAALGQRWCGNEEHLFIKFDSWTAVELPLIHRAFPSVPWIFLFRDPIEVLVSQLAHRGAHMIPGAIEPELFEMTIDAVYQMRPEEYCARILAHICNAALEHHRACSGMFISYNQLPAIVPEVIAPFFALHLSDAEKEIILQPTLRDAKNPDLQFQHDVQSKRGKATEEIRIAAEKWLAPVYDQLDAVRFKGHP